ncbi:MULTISPECIES: SMP-30/gluconolactonase/LRE family protein [Niastella]|uniref:SMP-30/gluconolactonase/LRE family protein n=1 Tax=Niastella soli TaxID=2821487 RepID=A0ABS3YYM3_9BACT|nr:SMP-30/gluconolactonase/LRE family protein [Niastella soli]MBO9203018.1 SMP-30/gluconolactonase/LRE family protein [Niastella soli]
MKMTFRGALLCASIASCLILFSCSKNDSSSDPSSNPPKDSVVTPVVNSISPSHGTATTSVTIYGAGFSEFVTQDSVLFNGVKAVLVSASKTQIVAKVPLGCGTGKITVYCNGTQITGPVFTYDPSYVVSLLAGSGNMGFTNGTGAAASFWGLGDVVTDASGNVYVTEMGNHTIRKITPDGVVTTLAGGLGTGAEDGTGIDAHFYNVKGIAIDAAGTLYVCDDGNYIIRKITLSGVVTTLTSGGYGFADGPGATAKFSTVEGIAVDKNGNVYVCDAGNNRIRKITPAGVVSTLAGTGVPGGNDGPGASATFNAPIDVAVDISGNVYVTENSRKQFYNNVYYPGNNKIRKITPDGTVSTFAGSGAVGATNGNGAAASFNDPGGLCFDSNGNLYVTEVSGNSIRKITPNGDVTTVAGSISAGATNGTIDVATFKNPVGIAADNNGNLYVADFGNVMIRKLSLK